MDLRMEGFDATLQHFRKAGIVGDINDVNTSVSEVLGCAAGGEDLYAVLCEDVGYI